MNRYARQMSLPALGEEGQGRLSAAKVLVIGSGGLGSTVLPVLVGAGVGAVTVVDNDRVEESNLHRQTLFAERDCGRFKAEVAAEVLREKNREVRISARVETLNPVRARALVPTADLVLDCADNYAVSFILSDACLAAGVPLITASALGLSGYVGGFCGGAPSLRALFTQAPENAAKAAEVGVSGAVVAMVGALQAQMALAQLAGFRPSPLGQMLRLDAESYRFTRFQFAGAPEPERVFPFLAEEELQPGDQVLAFDAPLPPPCATRLVWRSHNGLSAWRRAENTRWPGAVALLASSAA